jgi:hypothetical protein
LKLLIIFTILYSLQLEASDPYDQTLGVYDNCSQAFGYAGLFAKPPYGKSPEKAIVEYNDPPIKEKTVFDLPNGNNLYLASFLDADLSGHGDAKKLIYYADLQGRRAVKKGASAIFLLNSSGKVIETIGELSESQIKTTTSPRTNELFDAIKRTHSKFNFDENGICSVQSVTHHRVTGPFATNTPNLAYSPKFCSDLKVKLLDLLAGIPQKWESCKKLFETDISKKIKEFSQAYPNTDIARVYAPMEKIKKFSDLYNDIIFEREEGVTTSSTTGRDTTPRSPVSYHQNFCQHFSPGTLHLPKVTPLSDIQGPVVEE